MDPTLQGFLESMFRWIHVVAGVLWIGLLYFFNWVNSAFAPTLDADSKKKVVPELIPRTLFWFRWGAAYTWISGVLLLALVYYHGGGANLFDGGGSWDAMAFLGLAITFLGVFLYDAIFKAIKDPKAQFLVGWLLASAAGIVFQKVCHFAFRGYSIHLGAMLGTIMAFNVWYRIWPAQQRIIRAVKEGQAPNSADAGLAGMRSKHNTYMSIPLIFVMVGQHHVVWATSPEKYAWLYLPLVILVGWGVCFMLYQKAKKVPGF